MNRLPATVLCAWCLALSATPALFAQDSEEEETDERSTEVEESDEAYRRRMELEDARQRNLGYTLPPESYAAQQEKLDKLPEESRDNIRDQLVNIIVEDGEWEPSDALKDYPYQPTVAAQADPELLQQEQEAWDEQIDKYHKREAAAFGTYLGPVPGPGNPDGEEGGAEAAGGAEGSAQAGAEQDGGPGDQAGEQPGAQEGSAGSAGTYEPYQSNRGSSGQEEVSTAGVQQSALDFLKGLQGQQQAQAAAPTADPGSASPADAAPAAAAPADAAPAAPAPANPQAAAEAAAQQAASPDETAQGEAADEAVEIDLTTPGIIAIEDLDKLEGAERPDDAEDSEPPR